DVVITTAAIPGKKSPVLVTAEMVARMPRGAVIVDLAAERGGDCELTRADETVVTGGGVTILGPTKLAATGPAHASQFSSADLVAFLLHVVKDGAVRPAAGDEIMEQTLLTDAGKIVQKRVRAILGLDAHGEGSAG